MGVKTQRPKRYANRGSVMSRQHVMSRKLRSGVTGSTPGQTFESYDALSTSALSYQESGKETS